MVKPIVANETFSHAVYSDNQTNNLVKSPDNDFGGLVKIKGKTIKAYSWFQVGHNLVGLALLCYAKLLLYNL
jgi:hypothetical protein